MATVKPTIILVPGAWHKPAAFAPLTSQLESAGYTVRGVELPSVGAEPPLEDFKPDVEAIRATVEAACDNDEDILMLMHSYGSVPSGEAVKGLDKVSRRKDGKQGGVAHLFYCSAFALSKGSSLIEACGGSPLPWFKLSANDKLVEPEDPANVFYGDLSPEQQQEQIAALSPHSYRTMFSKTSWEPYRDIPSTYLYCEQDKAIPIEVQKGMVEGSKGGKWETESLQASHSPFLSLPEKTARAVRKAAGETI